MKRERRPGCGARGVRSAARTVDDAQLVQVLQREEHLARVEARLLLLELLSGQTIKYNRDEKEEI